MILACDKCDNGLREYDLHCEGCKARFKIDLLLAKEDVLTRYDRHRHTAVIDREVNDE